MHTTGYYVHVIGAEPTTGSRFESRQSAHEYRQALGRTFFKHEITFWITDDDRAEWQYRENNRFRSYHAPDRRYVQVPWADDLYSKMYEGVINQDQFDVIRAHYAHVSREKQNMIAFTPDDCFGHEDRQLRLTPGRYLERYLSHVFTETERREYDADVRSYGSALSLKIATSADDIECAYSQGNAPSSCMSDSAGTYEGPCHPVRVYGDSDLALAYIGTLGKRISARAIIWPEFKKYGRIYGDTHAMKCVLESAGYTAGSMVGAKVQYITGYGDRFVMPYVDGIDTCKIVRVDGKRWVRLGEGSYWCQNTDGLAGEGTFFCCECNETEVDEYGDTCSYCQTYDCSHCGRNQVEEEGDTCESCQDATFTCEQCHDTYCSRRGDQYSQSDYNSVQVQGERYEQTVCDDCYSDLRESCVLCDADVFTDADAKHALCDDCESTAVQCTRCRHYRADNSTDCEYCSPYPYRCNLTYDLLDGLPIYTPGECNPDLTIAAVPAARTIRIECFDSWRSTPVMLQVPAFFSTCGSLGVHRDLRYDHRTHAWMADCPTYAVSHVATGLRVRGGLTRETALRLQDALIVGGFNWTMIDPVRKTFVDHADAVRVIGIINTTLDVPIPVQLSLWEVIRQSELDELSARIRIADQLSMIGITTENWVPVHETVPSPYVESCRRADRRRGYHNADDPSCACLICSNARAQIARDHVIDCIAHPASIATIYMVDSYGNDISE